MAIEAALAAVAEALNKNSALLETLVSKAKAGLEPKKVADEPKKVADDEAKEVVEEEAPKRRARAPKEDAPKKVKAPTVAEISQATKAYLEGVDDQEEYAARRNVIKGIIAKFGAPKMSEIAEEHRAEAIEILLAAQDKADKKEDGEDDLA
jgi:hypothetical protein